MFFLCQKVGIMNVFQVVKDNVTTRQVAEQYGIKVRRNGMTCCPFHDDKSPSMKVDNRFHCFGCQADGDVIDFTAQLYGLSSLDAAIKIASDFGLSYDNQRSPPQRKSLKRKLTMEQQFLKETKHCFTVLSEYLHLMKHWKVRFAPKIDDTELHPLFVEALQNITKMEYLLDTLLDGSTEDKAQLLIGNGKEVEKIERRIKGIAVRDPDAVIPTVTENECRNSRGTKKLADMYQER